MHAQGRTAGVAAHHTCASIDCFPAIEQRDQRCAVTATARAALGAPARKKNYLVRPKCEARNSR